MFHNSLLHSQFEGIGSIYSGENRLLTIIAEANLQ